ncbi:hypothetical protein DPSP01_012046 [Paraphaeosphaeria sporulosa]
MPSTRASARNDSSPRKQDPVAGSKRKADSNSPKGSRKAAKQTTIEESLAGANTEDPPKNPNEDAEMKDGPATDDYKNKDEEQAKTELKTIKEDAKMEETRAVDDDKSKGDKQVETEAVTKEVDTKTEDTNVKNGGGDVESTEIKNEGPVQESSQREKNIASNILEKGIVYFFTRNRVGIEDSESIGDLARTYFVLRPLPIGTKLGEGALPDLENNRLLALPKKVFPKSHSDRFMAFVEKANTTIQDLKDSFFKGDEYETRTQGTRRVEPVATVAEGVYFITRTEDRSTHLVYAITIPSKLGEVQEDLGLREQGSFVISVKNPQRPGPANSNLPQGPYFPKEFFEEFRGLAWSEVKPKYLDYPNTQILLIGEHTDNAVQATTKDQKHDKDTPKEELEKLEHEDELRVEHLHGRSALFD